MDASVPEHVSAESLVREIRRRKRGLAQQQLIPRERPSLLRNSLPDEEDE